MLVLTRKKGERVLIGDDIVVTLIDIRGDGVRIGFDAPRGVKIQRAEVVKAVTDANTEAAAASAETADLLVGLLAHRTRSSAEPPADGTGATDRRSTPVPPPQAADVPAPSAAAPRTPPKPTPPRRA